MKNKAGWNYPQFSEMKACVSMASMSCNLTTILFLSMFFLCGESLGYREKVGGRSEIRDVKSNPNVQALGNFSVDEYNRRLRWGRWSPTGSSSELRFKEVVRGERQVVSGVKYYMQICAASQDGVPKMFESVVVVKPWEDSKKLLHFSPTRNE